MLAVTAELGAGLRDAGTDAVRRSGAASMDTAALPGMIPLIGLCALAGLGAAVHAVPAAASDKVQGFAMGCSSASAAADPRRGSCLRLDWLLRCSPILPRPTGCRSVPGWAAGWRRCGGRAVALAECGGSATPSRRGHRRLDHPPRPTAARLITPRPPTAFLTMNDPQPSPKYRKNPPPARQLGRRAC